MHFLRPIYIVVPFLITLHLSHEYVVSVSRGPRKGSRSVLSDTRRSAGRRPRPRNGLGHPAVAPVAPVQAEAEEALVLHPGHDAVEGIDLLALARGHQTGVLRPENGITIAL